MASWDSMSVGGFDWRLDQGRGAGIPCRLPCVSRNENVVVGISPASGRLVLALGLPSGGKGLSWTVCTTDAAFDGN